MDIQKLFDANEKPLDNIPANGGFCGIFRKIGCVGDSMSSGEFEATNDKGEKTYHDMFEYSWGQFLARIYGTTVYNFSRGGMTAKEYCESFAEENDFWNPEKKCTAYIIALGVNDLMNCNMPMGELSDIDFENYENNKPTFTGYYAKIIQKYKEIQPDAKFFLLTVPNEDFWGQKRFAHAERLYEFAEIFSNCYVLDIGKYGPVFDNEFRKKFFLGGHMNPCGYIVIAQMVASYIDYIIRHNIDDFKQVGFIGTEHQYRELNS